MTTDSTLNAISAAVGASIKHNLYGSYCSTEKVEKVDIDLDNKKVFVTSALSADELLETIKKTGKETSYVGVKA